MSFEDGSYSAMDDGGAREGRMDSSKEFDEILSGPQFMPDGEGSGTIGKLGAIDRQILLKAHHKATQARVREVLQRLVHLRETTYKNEGLGDLDMWIDAELSKLGEQGGQR